MMTTTTIKIRTFHALCFSIFLFPLLATGAFPPEFLEYEAARLTSKPHRSNVLLESLSAKCRLVPADAALCLIVAMEQLENAGPLTYLIRYQDFSRRLNSFTETLSKLPLNERLWAEARVYGYLGREYSPHFKRSLLALESLKRLEGETKWVQTYLWELRLLQGRKDLIPEKNAAWSERSVLETEAHGLALHFGARPDLGVSLSLDVKESLDAEELWQADVGATLGSRGVLLSDIGVKKKDALLGWEVGAGFYYGLIDFYGTGVGAKDIRSVWKATRFRANAKGVYHVLPHVEMRLGTYIENFHFISQDEGAILPTDSNDTNAGSQLEVRYDTVDNHFLPRFGEWIEVKWMAGFESLGSKLNSFTVLGHAEKFIPLGEGTTLEVGGGMGQVYVPRLRSAFLLSLGNEIPVPGARAFRYEGLFAGSLWTELRANVWGSLYAGVFSSISSVGDSIAQSLENAQVFGVGTYLTLSQGRKFGREVRLEVAQFGDGLHFSITSLVSAF